MKEVMYLQINFYTEIDTELEKVYANIRIERITAANTLIKKIAVLVSVKVEENLQNIPAHTFIPEKV